MLQKVAGDGFNFIYSNDMTTLTYPKLGRKLKKKSKFEIMKLHKKMEIKI